MQEEAQYKVSKRGRPPLLSDPKSVCQDALARYMQGEEIKTVAESYGVSNKTIYAALLEHAEDEWKKAQTATALAAYEDAVEQIGKSQTILELARARDLTKTMQWQLERVCRRIYGTEAPQVMINLHMGDVSGKIARLEAELGLRPAIDADQVIDITDVGTD